MHVGLFQETGVGERVPGGNPPSYHRGELGSLLRHQVSLVPPGLRHRVQQLCERRHTTPRAGWIVGPGVEGLAIRVQEDGQRPSSPAGEHLAGLHVDGVDVGSLFAVHLDVHEQPVHYLGRRRILEGLVGHHMAPVTRRIADRQQDGNVSRRRFREGFRSPFPPVHRVVGVLEEVGRSRGREPVDHAFSRG